MHVISLGYFCSVAEGIEKMGLRSASYPFDWVISDFRGVIQAINNHFENLLEYEQLYQSKAHSGRYQNMEYGISFFHDFNPYQSLQEQLPDVQRKYSRRIERFYESVSEPTLFIRYISDEDKINGTSKELLWIEENYELIMQTIKQFNEDNDILFIANEGVVSDTIQIYNVPRDENDTVSRDPIPANSELYTRFQNIACPDKAENIKRYSNRIREKNRLLNRLKIKLISRYKKIFLKKYIHHRQF